MGLLGTSWTASISPHTMKVAILGSCVSRDLFEFGLPQLQNIEIPVYISRATVLSLMAEPICKTMLPVDLALPAHHFEGRRFIQDLKKEQLPLLIEKSWDVLLVDFIDEIYATYICGSQALTYSNDSRPFIESWLSCGTGQLLRPPTLQAYQHSLKPMSLLGKRLREISGDKPIVLHKAKLATHHLTKNEVVPYEGEVLKRIELLNLYLEGLYNVFLENVPAHLLTPIDRATHVAGGNHKWDKSPFHYDEKYYFDIGKQFAELLFKHQNTVN